MIDVGVDSRPGARWSLECPKNAEKHKKNPGNYLICPTTCTVCVHDFQRT